MLNVINGRTQTKAPAPFGPVPSENQMRWQEMEYYAFVHFSLNTYTEQSWGGGNEDVNLFNPQKVDCRQWVRICRSFGLGCLGGDGVCVCSVPCGDIYVG